MTMTRCHQKGVDPGEKGGEKGTDPGECSFALLIEEVLGEFISTVTE